MNGLELMPKQKQILRPWRDLNQRNMAAGIVASLLAVTGPPAMILEAAAKGNFTTDQTILWFLSIYACGGIFGILMPLRYRMPIVGAHSITGVAFLATITNQFSYPDLIGAYIMSGLLMLLAGTLGVFSSIVNYVPKPVISAMLAGMITKYMTNYIASANQLPVIGAGSLLVYLYCSKAKHRIPPMVTAIAAGAVLFIATSTLCNGIPMDFVFPRVQTPEFSLTSFISVAIPLALLILSNDCAVGIGALEQNDYHPPINTIVGCSGFFSILTGFLGGQSANIGGMMTAICSSAEAGPKEQRYMGAIITGGLILTYGLFAWKLVPWIQALPGTFTAILVGLALLGVFVNSLQISFSQPNLKLSVTFAFIIALANITILGISAPVWSLLIGTLIARCVEK